MKVTTILLSWVLLLCFGCATQNSHRDPASVKQEKESAHEKFQGVFDKQY